MAAVNNKVDGVTITGDKVTVEETALDMTATATYTVKLAGDKFTLDFKGNTSTSETPAKLDGGVYTSAYTSAHFTGSGKEYTFVPATSPTTFKINGLGSGAKLGENVIVTADKVNISGGALSDTHATISLENATGYTLTLNDSLTSDISFNAKESGGTYNVTLGGTAAGYAKQSDGSYH